MSPRTLPLRGPCTSDQTWAEYVADFADPIRSIDLDALVSALTNDETFEADFISDLPFPCS